MTRRASRAAAGVAMLAVTAACGGAGRTPTPAPSSCGDPVAVQVLGSGGPIADDARASSGYVVWVGGRARLLVDLGAGTLRELAMTDADVADLDAVLISHLHVDHSADLLPLLKSASFGDRRRPLPIVGPTGSDRFPSLGRFLETQLGEGAYGYLADYLSTGNPFVLEPRSVDPSADASEVLVRDGLRVRAVGVPHGIVPALGFVVDVGETRIAFTGDQRMDDPRFAELAADADLLVAHLAIANDENEVAAQLHATPDQVGALASTTRARRLVLSHLMARSLAHLDDALATIGARYDGPTTVARDGLCVPVSTR